MTDDRRFHEGEKFWLPPMQYRLVPGRKGPKDLRLEWRWVSEWRPVELEHVALIVDAIGDNENVGYPPPGSGNGKLLAFVKQAMRDGWQQARHDKDYERGRRDDLPKEERYRRGWAS